jgi:hypothetical protein
MPGNEGRGSGEEKRDGKKGHTNFQGQATDLPYGFALKEFKRGLEALPYADGDIAAFHKALNLKSPTSNYVSKALRTLGLLSKEANRSTIGQEYVDSPAKRKAIIVQLIRKYPAYDSILKACAVDESMRTAVSFRWIGDKLAAEKKVTGYVAKSAAKSFSALVTLAELGTPGGSGKSRAITWLVSPPTIIAGSAGSVPAESATEQVTRDTDQNELPAERSDPSDANQNGNSRERVTIFSRRQSVGVYAIRPAPMGTTADMTNWTESQIRTYWEGHNRGLELVAGIGIDESTQK